jgi:glucosamine-6-phosphate deaminase
MKITIYQDYQEISQKVADLIIDFIKKKPDCLLCFAGGDTPRGIYRNLVKAVNLNQVEVQHCKFVGLDEWVGIDRAEMGSCRHLLDHELFSPLGIIEKNICFFDGKAANLEAECQKVDDFITNYGPIDLMLLGIGVNGHLGFNEPGTPFNSRSHLVGLQEITQKIGQKYFAEAKNFSRGITLGLQQISEAHLAVLVASGSQKADIVKKFMNSEVREELPASILKSHPNCHLFFDGEAAAEIKE